ncbi:hypothetical protein [Agromyces sp. GXS1127]|uniref:hypothetical protein n=1 Tax=Agromyces sp. GXS1127 TaxID=3424181 RepID=UPI003D31FE40
MTTRSLTITAAAIASGILLFTGCTSTDAQQPIATSTTQPSSMATFTPPDQPDVSDDQELVDEPPAAEQSKADAITAATAIMTAFARPDLPEAEWWNGMLPLLSQEGAAAYEGTLPETIPVTAVRGDATVLEGATDVITLVEVPTDSGPYVITLTRSDASQPWLAERIRPKQG